MKLLFLLLTTFLFARDNPFKPVVNNENGDIIKKQYFQKKVITLPSDARVLKSVKFEYQTLTGAIKVISFKINKSVNWHDPIKIETQRKIIPTQDIKIAFLDFYIKQHKVLIQTKDKLIRKFMLIKPFRYVLDFRANKNFLTYTKTTNSFVKKIVLGNHSGFYRVVLYLDGTYKTNVTKTTEGYLIDFR